MATAMRRKTATLVVEWLGRELQIRNVKKKGERGNGSYCDNWQEAKRDATRMLAQQIVSLGRQLEVLTSVESAADYEMGVYKALHED